VDDLERRARLSGWFLTTHQVGEKTFWQWRRVADPDDGRHGIFWDEVRALGWMQDQLRRADSTNGAGAK
jgi:hypothetical protein